MDWGKIEAAYNENMSILNTFPLYEEDIMELKANFESIKNEFKGIKDVERACNKSIRALYILYKDYHSERGEDAFFIVQGTLDKVYILLQNKTMTKTALNRRNSKYEENKGTIIQAYKAAGTIKETLNLLHTDGILISDKQLRNILRAEGVY